MQGLQRLRSEQKLDSQNTPLEHSAIHAMKTNAASALKANGFFLPCFAPSQTRMQPCPVTTRSTGKKPARAILATEISRSSAENTKDCPKDVPKKKQVSNPGQALGCCQPHLWILSAPPLKLDPLMCRLLFPSCTPPDNLNG